MAGNKRLRDIPRHALVFGANDTTKSFTIKGGVGPPSYSVSPGKAVSTIVEIPNFTNAITGTFSIADPNGNSFFSKASLAKNLVTPISGDSDVAAEFPVFEGCVVTLLLSGAPGSVGTAYVTIYYK